jgi:disulfide bond formation protein DsbB
MLLPFGIKAQMAMQTGVETKKQTNDGAALKDAMRPLESEPRLNIETAQHGSVLFGFRFACWLALVMWALLAALLWAALHIHRGSGLL